MLPGSGKRPSRISPDFVLGVVLLGVISLLTIVPVGYVLVNSFNVASFSEPYRFGLVGWREVFSSDKTLDSIGYSVLLSIRIPIAVAISFVIAWLLIRVRIPGSRLIEQALWFGFFLPPLPITFGWILLLDESYGILNQATSLLPFVTGPVFSIYSVPGILWVHLTLSTVPIMVILLAPALRQLDAANEEAAEMGGAGALTTLRRVTIPLIAPAILTAFVAGLIRSFEVFEIEQILGTPSGIFVYATRIYDLISWEPPQVNQAMALSALFLAVMMGIAMLYQWLLRRMPQAATLAGKSARFHPRLTSGWSYVASGLLLLYIAVGILLPLIVLLLGSANKLFGFFFIPDPWTAEHWEEVLGDPNFVGATINSLVLGLSAASVGTLLYALVAWVLVRRRVWGAGLIDLFVWLPWAVPGLVLGISLMSLILGTPVLSIIYGTMVPLIGAMIIKDLPIGVQMIRASISQISKEFEESAAMSGAGFLVTFRRIVLPLTSPMLFAVFLLVFMATIRDISTTVLLAGPGTRTLSLLMFEFANSGKLESAAVIGVMIAGLSLAITTLAFRIGVRLGIER